MPLPVLLNIGSALAAIWPHAAASSSGAAVAAGGAAKDASVAGAAASSSGAVSATGAKVRVTAAGSRLSRARIALLAARPLGDGAGFFSAAGFLSAADFDARALSQAAGVDGAWRTSLLGTAEAGHEASEAWTATKVAALAACTLGTARLTATAASEKASGAALATAEDKADKAA
jgi:hypothetical protein